MQAWPCAVCHKVVHIPDYDALLARKLALLPSDKYKRLHTDVIYISSAMKV